MGDLHVVSDFIGQQKTVSDLGIHMRRAHDKGEAIGHIALYGPPGLGKTTLARLIAQETGVRFFEVVGQQLSKGRDVEDMILNITTGDILFIDEAHSLRRAVMEMLYSPMQDFKFGGFDINPFTLIAATTHMGALQKPLRDRIVHDYEFVLYAEEDLKTILGGFDIPEVVAEFIAKRSKGVPRHACNYLIKVKGYQHKAGADMITVTHCKEAFDALEIDERGLGRRDRLLLAYLKEEMAISPARAIGCDAICKALNIEEGDYLHMLEPFLLRERLISRTGRGRIITQAGFKLLGS